MKIITGITKVLFSISFLVVIVILAGCDYSKSTQIFQITVQASGNRSLSNIYLSNKKGDVCSELETMINSGEYNIVSIKTTYSSNRLTEAEVTYDTSGRGEGNDIRILLLHQEDAINIKSRLDNIFGSGKYSIITRNVIYKNGYLFSAEIYYR